MSKLASSDCATRLTSAASRLTPRLILPDFTTTAREVTLLITASSEADKPVVPIICTRPRWAAIATLAMVAPGTVKSRMPSAFADSAHKSAESLMPFSGRPASTPASFPRRLEPGASSAPVSTAPWVSAMTRVSVRPIRPPAPATINRMSAMAYPLTRPIAGAGHSGNRRGLRTRPRGSGLRAVIALDDNQVGDGMRLPDLDVLLVFRRAITGECRVIVGKFDHDVARTALAFHAREPAAAHDVAPTETLEDCGIRGGVGFVAFLIVNVDATDPVTFCHVLSPSFTQRAAARSRPRLPRQRLWDRQLPTPDG